MLSLNNKAPKPYGGRFTEHRTGLEHRGSVNTEGDALGAPTVNFLFPQARPGTG
jgi:hypothetical protein